MRSPTHAGHHHNLDGSWLAFMQHLGVNSACYFACVKGSKLTVRLPTGVRSFGVAGLGITGAGYATIQQMATSTLPASNNAAKAANLAYWGCGLDKTPVTTQAQFNANVALLSGQYGRSPSNPAGWAYPPAWTQLDLNFNTTDTSSAAAEMVGNPAASVKALNNLGISTLMVYWLSCTASTFIFQQATMSSSDPVYWGERWEVCLVTQCVYTSSAYDECSARSFTSINTSWLAGPGSAASLAPSTGTR